MFSSSPHISSQSAFQELVFYLLDTILQLLNVISKAPCDLAADGSLAHSVTFINPDCVLSVIPARGVQSAKDRLTARCILVGSTTNL